jgi:crotonobetainyl-CoA:carnitine CoA-transferase CaiB-like acyl-CoA transferase
MLPFPADAAPPLAGVRVLEAARVLAGPFCGQLLADLGADVVKVERPGTGDETRGWGPPFRGPLSAYFLSCNRSKRSVTLDLHHPDGAAVFDKLLAASDVLIENFRTDSLPKLGLDPAAVLARHPRLVVCSISGYGRTGPMAEVPGYDFAVQALSGLMSITGPAAGEPHKVGVAVADILTALYASTAILACLHARQASGHGYHIDLALHDCALAAQVNVAQAYRTSGVVPPRQGNFHLQIVPYGLYPTADGHLVLNVGNDGQWRAFCGAAGVPPLADQYPTNPVRVERRAAVDAAVGHLMKQRKTAVWVKLLTEANVPHAVVRDYAGVFADEQVRHRGMALTVTDPRGQPVDLVGSPFHIAGAGPAAYRVPPELGADTATVLAELAGLGAEQVAELRTRGVV